MLPGTNPFQKDAAIAAGVSRFIPADFSSDFTKMSEGENKNFDLRTE